MAWVLTIIMSSSYADQVSFQQFESEKQCQLVAKKIQTKLGDDVVVSCDHV